MRRLAATLALVATLAGPARAADPVFLSSVAAPEKSAALRWCTSETKCATGRWYSDAQIVRIDQRVTGCENALGKAIFDTQVAQATVRIPAWIWVAAGGLVVGAAWGVREVAR